MQKEETENIDIDDRRENAPEFILSEKEICDILSEKEICPEFVIETILEQNFLDHDDFKALLQEPIMETLIPEEKLFKSIWRMLSHQQKFYFFEKIYQNFYPLHQPAIVYMIQETIIFEHIPLGSLNIYESMLMNYAKCIPKKIRVKILKLILRSKDISLENYSLKIPKKYFSLNGIEKMLNLTVFYNSINKLSFILAIYLKIVKQTSTLASDTFSRICQLYQPQSNNFYVLLRVILTKFPQLQQILMTNIFLVHDLSFRYIYSNLSFIEQETLLSLIDLFISTDADAMYDSNNIVILHAVIKMLQENNPEHYNMCFGFLLKLNVLNEELKKETRCYILNAYEFIDETMAETKSLISSLICKMKIDIVVYINTDFKAAPFL